MRILVVDDEPDILESVKTGLQRKGFEVDAYEDPEKALKDYVAGRYEIGILDVRMPKMNGFQLYREILKRDDKIRVRFLTAFEEYRDEFKRAFPDLDEGSFIKKPTSIARMVRELLVLAGP
jgi:two-component system, OmpR family, response regulator ChvI